MSIIPAPKVEIRIRPATPADVPFMDSLQKENGKALGWFPTKQFEGYVEMGGVLVAEAVSGRQSPVSSEGSALATGDCRLATARVGYVISKDRYSGRDDVGAIYQLAVAADYRRSLVGASLVKEAFARAAYGCRLFCCWCAQDLAANRFWESLGFVPVAFRTGSRGKKRTHILWERRVVAGDDCSWWYPFQTKGGAIREDRLVFPIAPGTHWAEAKPMILPEEARRPAELEGAETVKKALPAVKTKKKAGKLPFGTVPAGKMAIFVGGKVKYIDRPRRWDGTVPAPAAVVAPAPVAPVETPKREPRKVLKHERAALEFCRELRDRYLEKVAAEPWLLEASGKYDVARLTGGAGLAGPADRPALPVPAKLLSAA